ncbi:RagB/SusD family nutrient uptake outer membrane protein [Pedobacter sp. MC2016-15]|uniref:RagB/SusD family nutrient uptake outer membrane protein n=1 Tax=Pedobacter sp. MC2016-15 TaxID=2994473 RepID=UPI0022485E6E|nr:RagB/SusD family nutrient uptake outer membrane protein [Pedobacter sp. MC2016-15]MCX2481040.1 RagB/SusD family nutrient uptake outer membrane protein [Pedobacter sp. MC2016-15]
MKLQISILILAAGMLHSGCQKSILDQSPISTIATSNAYKTAGDFNLAVSGAYSSLQSGGITTNSYVLREITSDNALPVASGSVTDQDEFDRFYIRTTNPLILGAWNDSYNAINRVNTILDRIDGVTIEQALKSRYIAEAKFIRGLVYFNLVRTFGDVPLVLTEIKDPNDGYAYGRNAVAEVYTQIEKDLNEADAGLPTVYTGANIGRATKGAAKALLGRVLLTQKKFPLAATKLKEVIDLGIYSLVDNYADYFRVNNKNNRESVFEIQFKSGGAAEGNPWPNAFGPQNSGNAVIAFGGDGNNQPTNDMVMAYEPNDVRKDVTLATSYVNANGNTIQGNYVKKYFDVPVAKNDNGNNIPLIRYADVLLMYAECLNEQGYQSTGDAFRYLNQIRLRAKLPARTATEIPTQAAFRLSMEQERRVEFAFEGLRWYDLVRTDRAIPVLNAKKDIIGLVTLLGPNNLIFPIPQSQIDINSSKIQQNPGY